MASTCAENDAGLGEFVSALKAALSLEQGYADRLDRPAYASRPGSSEARAAVLAVFGWSPKTGPENPSGISLLLTRRTETVESHKGQMAFPGGKCEPEELEQGRFSDTALRETEEEVGIHPSDVEILGELPGLSTATGFWVAPFVGILKRPLEQVTLKLNAGEIAELVWVPWSVLTHPATYRQETFERGAIRFLTHVYQVGEHRIWGATGAIIKNLLDRLHELR